MGPRVARGSGTAGPVVGPPVLSVCSHLLAGTRQGCLAGGVVCACVEGSWVDGGREMFLSS